jgi:CheY-like chemotaxis protein
MPETLTRDTESVQPPVSTVPSPVERMSGLHVLVADAGQTRSLREQQLLAAGHRVSVARTAFEALVKATFHLPDMILLDPKLPDIGAIETMGFLNTCPATAHIPVARLAPGRTVPQRILATLRKLAR